MYIESKDGKSTVFLSPMGLSVTRWQIMGKDILFPMKKVQNNKVRGMTHSCVPWFGPKKDLPQHGLIRQAYTKSYNVKGNTITADFPCNLVSKTSKFPWDFATRISVKSFENKLVYLIEVTNVTSEAMTILHGKMPCQIGFHPYIQTNGYGQVKWPPKETTWVGDWPNGEHYEISTTENFNVSFKGKDFYLVFESKTHMGRINKHILWTDNREKYFCVEPIGPEMMLSQFETYKAEFSITAFC